MGNHECDGSTTSNCGPGNFTGVTDNYTAFINTMLHPLGLTEPFFEKKFSATDNSWTAKLVVIACNAWTSQQSTWLDHALAEPTTYTFIVRAVTRGVDATTAALRRPSGTIIAHPIR